MALDFPSSPTNNQVYENYIYSATSGAWQKLPGNTFATTAISDTPPVNPANGDLWWNSNDGKFYIYYSDGSSAQWVSAALPAVAVSDTPPAGYDGQMWLDSNDGSMYVYYTDPGGASSSWIGAVSRSGGILQVLNANKITAQSTTSTIYEDVSGLSLTITPRSTSSKVLVMVNLSLSSSVDNGGQTFGQVLRDTTAIGNSVSDSSMVFDPEDTPNNVVRSMSPRTFIYLDSPSTTSSTTYKVQFRTLNSSWSAHVNRSGNSATPVGTSSITVMEVAG